MRKPEVKEKLYLVDAGNRVTRNNPGKQREVVVTKVGRKYFTIQYDSWNVIFKIEDWYQKTNYCADFILYESKEEYERSILVRKYWDVSRKFFNDYGPPKLSLEKLEKIIEIIGE